MIGRATRGRISRRKFLAGTGVAAVSGPMIWTRRSSAGRAIEGGRCSRVELGGDSPNGAVSGV